MKFKTLLGACVACVAFSNAAAANVEYYCGQDNAGVTYTVTHFDEEDIAEVFGVAPNGSRSSALLRPESRGSYRAYVSASRNTEFAAFGENTGDLTVQGSILACEVTSITVPGGGNLPVVPQGGGGVPSGSTYGQSFGGNLRAGPGTNFADMGSTFNGQQLTLVGDTGVYMNGYSWWIIMTNDNGPQVYQWGGLLCSPGQFLPGIYNEGC